MPTSANETMASPLGYAEEEEIEANPNEKAGRIISKTRPRERA